MTTVDDIANFILEAYVSGDELMKRAIDSWSYSHKDDEIDAMWAKANKMYFEAGMPGLGERRNFIREAFGERRALLERNQLMERLHHSEVGRTKSHRL
jgi:hypothetical protein